MDKVILTEEDCKKLGLRRVIRLGVNVFDLNHVPPLVLKQALTDPDTNKWRISQDRPYVVSWDKPDEQCAEFYCSILTAALCLDILRNELRQSQANAVVRGYICTSTDPDTKKPIWKRFPHNAVLTLTEKGSKKIVLNPEFFPMKDDFLPLAPPQSSFVFRGRRK